MSASQPRILLTAPLGSATSPATSTHPSAASAPARDGFRTSAVTASPRARSARTTAPITNPLAPVTNTLIGEYSRAFARLGIRERSHARALHRTRKPDERARHQPVDR